MGTNSSRFDKQAHYDSKTTRELQELQDFWVKAAARHPATDKIANEELAVIRLKIAERIGKRKS